MRASFFKEDTFLNAAYEELADLEYCLNQTHELLIAKEKVNKRENKRGGRKEGKKEELRKREKRGNIINKF